MTALLLALSKASYWGWASIETVSLITLGMLLIVVWVPVQLRSSHPLVDIRVATRPAVLLVNLASFLAGFAMFVNMVGTTQLLQQAGDTGYGLGLDILGAGLWMTPTALVFGAWSPMSAAMIRRYGAHLTLLGGALVMAVAYVARVFLSYQLWQIVAGAVVVGIGTSMTFAAMPSLIMAAVPASETASANGLNTLLRSIGTATASAALAALTTGLVADVGGVLHTSFVAFTTAFWFAAGASMVAGLLAVPLGRLDRRA